MYKLLLLLLLIASPAWAQAQAAPKGTAARADPCAPIGKTARGELVYSMKCDNLPGASSPPPTQAETREVAPPAEPETRKGGLFGWSFDRRKPDE
jgi:hypothetical protein